ncbi:MAG: zf-HC2 domain-containing protein [Planctomycetota bacterium]|jgi:anti-sigma factor RsiW
MENNNSENCKRIEDLLIDYADKQLPPDESSKVAEHLSFCLNCRLKVEALNKSLILSRVIFEDNLSQIEDIQLPVAKRTRIKWIRPIAVAAAVLFVASLFLIFQTQQTAPVEQTTTASSLDSIECQINQAAIAAKLLATADLLTKYPDNQNIVQNQYYHIIETYPNTSAAEKAKLLVK